MWPNLFAPAKTEHSGTYWRSLSYFSAYRVIVACLILASFILLGHNIAFGQYDRSLFLTVSIIYLATTLFSWLLASTRWLRFTVQLTSQVAADSFFITVLMYASGGIRSGLGMLLLVTLVASSLVSHGRLALFHAALASIAILISQFFQAMTPDGNGDFLQAGLLSIAFFATSGLTYLLAKRLVATEQVALRQSIDLANLAQVNQLVIRDMQDGVLVVDGQGHVRQWNDQAERLLGAFPYGRKGGVLSDYSKELAERFALWSETGDILIQPLRVSYSNKSIRVRLIPIGGDKSLGAVMFLEDMSRLQVQAQQLKLAALGRLTANIAHEIRNPLSAIGHATQLLQEEEVLEPTQARLLQIILDNTFRLDRLVQDVLQLNRKDRSKPEDIALGKYLNDFIYEFCQTEKIPQSAFYLEIEGQIYLTFDRYHLHQLLWNLCRNAWRHGKKQDGSIRILAGRTHQENVVQLDIIDDGPGVPQEMQSQLFEPFFTTVSTGTGLGLYIARELCAANNATLDYVEVSPGGQFRVCGKGSVT